MATKEQLAKIIQGRAAALCSPEGDRMINNYSRNASTTAPQRGSDGSVKYTDIPKPDYNYDTDYDSMYLSEERQQTNLENYGMNGGMNSNMPDAIKRSMMNERIDVSSLDNTPTGFLDKLNKQESKQQSRKQPINEATNYNTSSIDYALIKSIVKECLDESRKQMLNEDASLKHIRLSGGTIKLVDNSGNVYSAKLEKVGNLNDKKKQ